MKKFLQASLFLFLFSSICSAEELKVIGKTEMDTRPSAIDFNVIDPVPVVNKIPSLKNGVYYSMVDHRFNYSATVPLLEKNGFSLNIGYAGDAENTGHKLMGSIAYDLGNLEKWGVTVPILKYVGFEPYLTFAGGNLNFKEMGESESDWGIGANIFSLSF